MTGTPPLSPDAATVVGLAGTAVLFARSPYEESERWLRALRLYGDAGATLQALGVGEAPLAGARASDAVALVDPRCEPGKDVVASVVAAAAEAAEARGEATIATVDVLIGVMRVYGASFEHALERRGTTSAELVERLGGPVESPARIVDERSRT